MKNVKQIIEAPKNELFYTRRMYKMMKFHFDGIPTPLDDNELPSIYGIKHTLIKNRLFDETSTSICRRTPIKYMKDLVVVDLVGLFRTKYTKEIIIKNQTEIKTLLDKYILQISEILVVATNQPLANFIDLKMAIYQEIDYSIFTKYIFKIDNKKKTNTLSKNEQFFYSFRANILYEYELSSVIPTVKIESLFDHCYRYLQLLISLKKKINIFFKFLLSDESYLYQKGYPNEYLIDNNFNLFFLQYRYLFFLSMRRRILFKIHALHKHYVLRERHSYIGFLKKFDLFYTKPYALEKKRFNRFCTSILADMEFKYIKHNIYLTANWTKRYKTIVFIHEENNRNTLLYEQSSISFEYLKLLVDSCSFLARTDATFVYYYLKDETQHTNEPDTFNLEDWIWKKKSKRKRIPSFIRNEHKWKTIDEDGNIRFWK